MENENPKFKFFWNYTIGRAVINNIEILSEIQIGIKKNLDLHKLKIIQVASCIEAILEDQINRILDEKYERDTKQFHKFKEYLENEKNKKGGLTTTFKYLIKYFKDNPSYLNQDEQFYKNLHRIRVLRNWSHLRVNTEKIKYFPEYNEEKSVCYNKHSKEALDLFLNLVSTLDQLHFREGNKSKFKDTGLIILLRAKI